MPFLAVPPPKPANPVFLPGTRLAGQRGSLGDLEFARVDDDGTAWDLVMLDGWGSPGSTVTVDQRTNDHGGWATKGKLKPRVLAAKIVFDAPDRRRAWAAWNRINAAASLEPTLLTVDEGGVQKSCLVVRQDDVLPTWESDTVAECSIQLVAPDPRKYGPERRYSTGLPSSVGGLSVPFTVPLTVDAVVTTGSFTVVNGGNFETPGRLVVRGPVQDPRITAVVDGRERTLAWDLTLGATDWLDIDLDRRTAYQNGTASRIGSMTSRQWWKFPFGTTEVGFNASTYSQGASLDALVKPAWM